MRTAKGWASLLLLTILVPLDWAQTEKMPRLRVEERVEKSAIPFEVRYQFSRTVGQGRLIKQQDGKNGEVRRVYRVLFANGKPSQKVLLRTERTEPTAAIMLMGTAGYASSRGTYMRGAVKVMRASAYDPSAGRGRAATFRTASGLRAQYGVVAVDPKVIPLGTRVYVEGYGYAIAADTGGAIKGNRIDLCVPSRAAAMRFGRREVRVHILRPAK